jgi:hypothetical protein
MFSSSKYTVHHRGIAFSAEPFYGDIKSRLDSLIKNRGNNDELNAALREIQARKVNDPLRQKVAAIVEEEYFLRPDSIVELKRIIGIDESGLTFSQPVSCITCTDDDLTYMWDLGSCFKIVRSQFMRELELKTEQDSDDSDGWWWASGATPSICTTRFIFKSFLVEIEYKDYFDDYLHGDDLWVRGIFKIPRSLDCLLIEPIVKKPLAAWMLASGSLLLNALVGT